MLHPIESNKCFSFYMKFENVPYFLILWLSFSNYDFIKHSRSTTYSSSALILQNIIIIHINTASNKKKYFKFPFTFKRCLGDLQIFSPVSSRPKMTLFYDLYRSIRTHKSNLHLTSTKTNNYSITFEEKRARPQDRLIIYLQRSITCFMIHGGFPDADIRGEIHRGILGQALANAELDMANVHFILNLSRNKG